ncbi:hypothetical protein Angca_005351, partial [Angiostrongylus cantonensis]
PFDPTRHNHVIENGFCNICQIHVNEKTKHCRRCNVCVEVFDHHCIWLNNCIGKKNYGMFIIMVISIVLSSSGVTILSFCQIFFWFTDLEGTKRAIELVIPFEIPMLVFLMTSLTSLASHLAIAVTTAHLLQFHVKLRNKGLTTYRFIMDQRQ